MGLENYSLSNSFYLPFFLNINSDIKKDDIIRGVDFLLIPMSILVNTYFKCISITNPKISLESWVSLDKSFDFNILPNIENLVVKKYNQIREIIVKKDQRAYNELTFHHSLTFYNSIYHTSEKDIEEGETAQLASMSDRLQDREVPFIEDYELKFYAQNNIVALWQSQTMYPMISVKSCIYNESSPNGIKYFHIPDFIFLYLPNENSELEIW